MDDTKNNGNSQEMNPNQGNTGAFPDPSSYDRPKTEGNSRNYSADIPGPTRYDHAKNEYRNPGNPRGISYYEQKEKSKSQSMAIASLVLSIASIGILLFIPIVGIPISIISAVLGIVFGVMGRKSNKESMATAGLIVSIVDLVFVIVYCIVLAVFGGALFALLAEYARHIPLRDYSNYSGYYYFK